MRRWTPWDQSVGNVGIAEMAGPTTDRTSPGSPQPELHKTRDTYCPHSVIRKAGPELGPKLAVAVGLALSGLGGKAGLNFRQEELAFTKGFDRIKFPLAVACMLALFLVLIFAVRLRN